MIAILAIASVVLLASADDRELVARWPDGTEMRACAKAGTPDPCEMARRGRWQPVGTPPLGQARTWCVPHPGCFSDRSNHIEGYR
jgi:hypothetical protein